MVKYFVIDCEENNSTNVKKEGSCWWTLGGRRGRNVDGIVRDDIILVMKKKNEIISNNFIMFFLLFVPFP